MEGFNNRNLEIFNDSKLLRDRLISDNWQDKNLLMMSSGDFDGMDLGGLATRIVE
jgi:UDP-N-acetylmuramate: L-alanyl-gamma-D-glutamyl-meso-diaminopimelate ligase